MSYTITQLRAMRHECLTCGTPLPDDSGAKRTYCDAVCRQRHYRAERRGQTAAEKDERKCAHCGGPMEGKKGGARFCSKSCVGKAARRRISGEPATACRHCGGSMEGKAPQAIYCGARCNDRARRAREREARKATPRVRKPRPDSNPNAQKYKPGHRFGDLVLIERLGGKNGTQYALCRCDCGNEKRLSLSNLANGATTNCADRSHHPDPRIRETVTYSGAHSRVRLAKGSASEHLCPCGKQAEQWAYSHAEYDELRDGNGKEKGKPFSTNPDHYAALCRGCHSRWDKARRDLAPEGVSLVHVALWLATTPARDEVEVAG